MRRRMSDSVLPLASVTLTWMAALSILSVEPGRLNRLLSLPSLTGTQPERGLRPPPGACTSSVFPGGLSSSQTCQTVVLWGTMSKQSVCDIQLSFPPSQPCPGVQQFSLPDSKAEEEEEEERSRTVSWLGSKSNKEMFFLS